MVANSSSVLDKIVSLARAGVYFCEGYTGRILIANCLELSCVEFGKNIAGEYTLGPEEGKLLLFKRDEIYKSDLVGISQTSTVGVVRIAVFDNDMAGNIVYTLHMQHDTLPKGVEFESLPIELYNKFRRAIVNHSFS